MTMLQKLWTFYLVITKTNDNVITDWKLKFKFCYALLCIN